MNQSEALVVLAELANKNAENVKQHEDDLMNLFNLTCKTLKLNMILVEFLTSNARFGSSAQWPDYQENLDTTTEILEAAVKGERYVEREERDDFSNRGGRSH